MRRWTRGVVGALAMAGIAPAVCAQDWPDIEGRIQYAYYTDDARTLQAMLASLKPRAVDGEEAAAGDEAISRAYFRALAHYRLAQVLSASKKSEARHAIGDCADEADNAVAALPKVPTGLDEAPEARRQRAEAYVLATACTLAGREMTNVPFAGGRIGSRIDEAVKLEPKNPRVRLVEALVAFDRANEDEPAERAAAIEKLRAVTEMFETARAGAATSPEWGAAEAYAFLGRALYAQSDVVGAREALERALLIAPDFGFARRLMAQITR